MSAGTGVAHSEFNASKTEPVHFLQVWIIPAIKGVTPQYQQKNYSVEEKRGKLKLILSTNGEDGSLIINQDARVYAGLFDGTEQALLSLEDERYAYIHVARGSLSINDNQLSEGDGMRIRNARNLRIANGQQAEVLIFDLRPNELPQMK